MTVPRVATKAADSKGYRWSAASVLVKSQLPVQTRHRCWTQLSAEALLTGTHSSHRSS